MTAAHALLLVIVGFSAHAVFQFYRYIQLRRQLDRANELIAALPHTMYEPRPDISTGLPVQTPVCAVCHRRKTAGMACGHAPDCELARWYGFDTTSREELMTGPTAATKLPTRIQPCAQFPSVRGTVVFRVEQGADKLLAERPSAIVTPNHLVYRVRRCTQHDTAEGATQAEIAVDSAPIPYSGPLPPV